MATAKPTTNTITEVTKPEGENLTPNQQVKNPGKEIHKELSEIKSKSDLVKKLIDGKISEKTALVYLLTRDYTKEGVKKILNTKGGKK